MSRNRYTQLVHEQERLHMVRLEKRLIVLIRELRSGVVVPIDPLLFPIDLKASRAARSEQKFRHTAKHTGGTAGRIADVAGREGKSAYQDRTQRRPELPTQHLIGRSSS